MLLIHGQPVPYGRRFDFIDAMRASKRLGQSLAFTEALGAGSVRVKSPKLIDNTFLSLQRLAATSETRN